MRLLNHSSPEMTFLYATITEEETHVLFDDIAQTYKEIISGAFNGLKENVVNVSYDRVMEIIKFAYKTGKDDADQDDRVHEDNMQALEELLEGVIV